jgi:hypothetical protein
MNASGARRCWLTAAGNERSTNLSRCPRGRALQDTGNYIIKLPKAEHEAPEWQAAMQELLLVAKSGGPTMLARIGIMQALRRHEIREFDTDRKPHHWGKRKLTK